MIFSLRARRTATSSFIEPNSSPQSFSSCVSATTRATCSRAFEGMHPRRRQVPPSRGSASTSVTCIPLSAAKNAAA